MRQIILVTLLVLLTLMSGFVATTSHAQDRPPLFAPAPGSPIPVEGGPGNVALGDLNADGKLDLLVSSGQKRSITLLLGQGDGQFRSAPVSPILLPDPPGEMVLGDIDGNRTIDLVVVTHDSYAVILLLGDGKGRFALAPNPPVAMKKGSRPHTHGLGIGDLNGDGKPDLVTANNNDNDIAVVFGDGRGGFTPAPGSPFAVAPSPYPLTLGDINSDDHLDIVSTSTAESSRALTVLFGDGRGGFRRSDIQLRTVRPWYVAIDDLNGDGKPDMVSSHAERNELTVLIANSTGGFTETPDSPYDLGHSAWRVLLVDVNRDGNADVVAAADKGVRIMLGDGRGGFSPVPGSPFPAGGGAWRHAIGDLNGDGKPDIATSNLESNSVTILLAQ